MAKWSALVSWVERARHLVNARDLLWLTPPGVLAIVAGFALDRRPHPAAAPPGEPVPPEPPDLTQRDPALIELVHDLFRALGRYYFRLEIQGVHHVPPSGPVMLVGNHNGAILPLDVLFAMTAVRDQLGPGRIMHALSHDGIFFHPTIRRYADRLGVLRASPAASAAVLEAGRVMLVYPGSDWDASRSFAERGLIELAGRKGFIRSAFTQRVPIIPVVSVGTHEQLIILTRGEGIARAFHLPELMRTKTFPIGLALPWGLTSALLPYLPLPAQTTVAFGPPIDFAELIPGGLPAATADEAAAYASDPALVERAYDLVTARMQAMLDELSADRRPLLGKKKPAGKGGLS